MVFVGGFLGAGKTTLLSRAAKHFVDRGQRVGLITNDQADDLVDTGYLEHDGLDVKEVSGGCFCCRFDDLARAAEGLLEALDPDILLGEPVGSCTDISATVLQPCKALYGDWFRVAPFSVLTDPRRLAEAVTPDAAQSFPENVTYIFRKQLEEADLIVLNKIDTLSASALSELRAQTQQAFPGTPLLTMSALTGEGVDEWLAWLSQPIKAGARIAEVDYDRYAEGEAVLGWLNASVQLRSDAPVAWQAFCQDLLQEMQNGLLDEKAEIAHLKLLLNTDQGMITANITSSAGEARFQGSLAGPSLEAALVLNARVHVDPAVLKQKMDDALAKAAGDGIDVDVVHCQSLRPGRPEPKHRYAEVVQ